MPRLRNSAPGLADYRAVFFTLSICPDRAAASSLGCDVGMGCPAPGMVCKIALGRYSSRTRQTPASGAVVALPVMIMVSTVKARNSAKVVGLLICAP